MEFSIVILTSFLTTVFSLLGGFLLLFGTKKSAKFVQKYGTFFAIAVLLYVVFFDIIPEVLEESFDVLEMILLILFGLGFCFFVSFFASHFHKHGEKKTFHDKKQAFAMLIVDSLHTIIDGIVLGVSFSAGLGTGLLSALATTAHEIPQEIGDFSIMIRSKMPKKKILKLQLFSGLLLVPSATITFLIGNGIENLMPIFESLIAGFFLYIAFGEIWSIIKR